MYKKIIISLLLAAGMAHADTISIVSPYSPTHAGTPALIKITEAANRLQTQHNFVLEFKPGANGLLALQAADYSPQDKLVLVHAGYAELLDENKIKDSDFTPVWSLGAACWAVVSNTGQGNDIKSLQNRSEIVAGGVGFGTAAHITAIMIGEKLNVPVRFITYKSAGDVLVAMAGNNGPTLGMSPLAAVNALKEKNPNLHTVAMSCPRRHQSAPELKTLVEQGIKAPYIFNNVLSSAYMKSSRRAEIAKILEDATAQVGLTEIISVSAMRPPQFDKVSAEAFHNESVSTQRYLNARYKQQIENHKQGR